MKRAAWLTVLVLALVLGAVVVWRRQSFPSPVSPAPVAGAPAAPGQPAPPGLAPPPAPPGVSPAFASFLESDSKLLDSMHVDAHAAEERLLAEALRMGEAEVAYARQLALTAKAPANERILAVALLASPAANPHLVRAALADIVTQGMNSARAEPHTVDELSNVQAKSFALMAVDAIAERAKKDPAAREDLVRLGAEAKDTTIRKYIAEKLAELGR